MYILYTNITVNTLLNLGTSLVFKAFTVTLIHSECIRYLFVNVKNIQISNLNICFTLNIKHSRLHASGMNSGLAK